MLMYYGLANGVMEVIIVVVGFVNNFLESFLLYC
jgi:hypothetical protein